jgi:hypothetical protein
MFRLIALYFHYRDLQEERARAGVTAAPSLRVVPIAVPETPKEQSIHALAA